MTKVFLAEEAKEDYYELPKPEQKKVYRKLSLLEENPFSGKKLGGELKGFYSLKAWPYRIIYFIKRNGEVWVVHIPHRQGAYK